MNKCMMCGEMLECKIDMENLKLCKECNDELEWEMELELDMDLNE